MGKDFPLGDVAIAEQVITTRLMIKLDEPNTDLLPDEIMLNGQIYVPAKPPVKIERM